MTKINFIDIDPEGDIELLNQKYEELTDKTLYPAQDEAIMLKVLAYYANVLKCQFNDAANLNLVQNSRYPILDFLGKMKNCERLEDEGDEAYIERILLAPEGFSVAGPQGAYIYLAKSADSRIKDVALDVVDEPIKVNDIEIDTQDTDTNDFDISIDDDWQEVTLTLKRTFAQGETIKVKIPNPYKIRLYILTDIDDNDENAQEDINEVLQNVSDYLVDKTPIADTKKIYAAQKQTFVITGRVILEKDAILDTVQSGVNEALNDYLEAFKNALNKEVVRHQIISKVCAIEGVHDFDLGAPASNLEANPGVNYCGSIGSINYERIE